MVAGKSKSYHDTIDSTFGFIMDSSLIGNGKTAVLSSGTATKSTECLESNPAGVFVDVDELTGKTVIDAMG